MIAIIDYKAGNLKSVERALRYLGVACRITNNHSDIISSDRVIFPGVGAAGNTMEVLRSLNLDRVIREVVRHKTPFLGICLGAQIILETSEEDDADCLNLIAGRVKRFTEMGLKIPHMGWNSISIEREHPILKDINPEAQFYFVHSYYPEPLDREHIIATTHYGIPFASIIGRDNVVATQFHPEKSGRFGLHMLKNFIEWNVTC